MHVHILGICGTFMGGLALLARQLGFKVTGSDAGVYPPMSTQLEAQGITLIEGYDPAQLDPAPDCVVVGNAMSRGNPAVEYMLDHGLPYLSGPAFLAQHIIPRSWVLAVAGTHGKTTTASMLAWILEYAGLAPGFLIGGVPQNFGISARLGKTPFFVIEADEYDTAFFDKRSKFVHYRPRTLIMNNLEYDHADIFPDLDAIKRQFHHLIRIVPGSGLIVAPSADANLADVLSMGCWTPVERFGDGDSDDGWRVQLLADDAGRFEVYFQNQSQGVVDWDLIGRHNMLNALAAIAAARHAGVPPAQAIAALARFENVKRRMEHRGTVDGVSVYDDFAHHPTAIATTLAGLRNRVGKQRIVAVLEPRSNTMRLGVHKDTLAQSLAAADEVFFYQPANLGWDLDGVVAQLGDKAEGFDTVAGIVEQVARNARDGDHVLVMSNGGFENIHQRLLEALQHRVA